MLIETLCFVSSSVLADNFVLRNGQLLVATKINDVVKEGWSIAYITSGVESDSGKDDGKGIFITTIFFVKK